MADNVTIEAEVDVQGQNQPDFSAELQQQMSLSLGIGNPINVDSNQVEGGQSQQTQQAVESSADSNTQVTTSSDPFGFIKEKFGYGSHEDAIREIEELRAFKAQPQTPSFDVPDDESAAILRALAAGKREEVWRLLDHDMKIDRLVNAEVSKDNAAEIVKMGMQIKYKDLTPDEINYKFNKQFAIPAEPKQMMDEDDVDFQARLSEWKNVVSDKQMELMIEAKLAKPELQSAKIKFDIPEIETPVDEGYIQYQQMLEKAAENEKATSDAYKAFVPKSIETKINFKDEANKIDFTYQFEPDANKFAKAVEMACDQQQFWSLFKKPDGSPDRERFLDMICFAIDKENYLLSAMNQAKNATIKASLPDNSQSGLVRQIAQHQEPNEIDQQMRYSLRGFGGF